REMDDICEVLTRACRSVDPTSTEEAVQHLKAAEKSSAIVSTTDFGNNNTPAGFAAGIFDS
ncbi:MAG TPA: hypothetical protein PKD72_07215, partial [Gemmatales bacterium]|nr:hypothetical protein [Gemmatales bacterium]